jgi:hypothetical protein
MCIWLNFVFESNQSKRLLHRKHHLPTGGGNRPAMIHDFIKERPTQDSSFAITRVLPPQHRQKFFLLAIIYLDTNPYFHTMAQTQPTQQKAPGRPPYSA